jgi:hypothetical protein
LLFRLKLEKINPSYLIIFGNVSNLLLIFLKGSLREPFKKFNNRSSTAPHFSTEPMKNRYRVYRGHNASAADNASSGTLSTLTAES